VDLIILLELHVSSSSAESKEDRGALLYEEIQSGKT